MSSNYIAIAFLFAFLIHTTLWHLGSTKKSYGFAPLILEHPRDTWANPNDTITLVCKADGNPSPTFTWFKNNEPYHHYHGNNVPFSQGDKEKLSSAWLRFDQLLSENEGAYHCEASNIHGRAKSTSALLRLRDTSSKKASKDIHDDKGQYLSNKISNAKFVSSANVIAKYNQKYSDDKFTPPTVITVNERETIELACPLMAIMNGTTNTNYNYATTKGAKSGLILQWWHKKLVGEKQSNTYQSSETTETQESVTDMNDWLIITPRHDFYNKNGMLDQPDYNKLPYPFDAPDKINELNNHVITLTSNGKLKFVSVKANNAGMYKCVIISNKATIELELGKGRHGHIHAQPDSILFQGAASATTKLNNDDLANVPLPLVSSLTNLIVFTKPQIIHPPADVTVLEGEDAEFECEVTGVPDPTVVWSRKSGASGYQLSIPYERAAITEGRKSLRISRVQSADAGTYVCEVRNRAGVVKAPAHLAVHVRPTFVVPPRDVSVLPGATATFDCVTTGNPTPSVYWTRESSQVLWFPGRPHGRFSVGLDGELRVTDVTSFDQGYYVCSALSVAGSSIAKAYLEVISSSSSNTKIIDDTIKQAGSQDKAQEEGIETPFDNDFNSRYKGENGQNQTDNIENLTYLTARDNVARRNVRVRPLPYHPPIITRGPVNQTLPPHTDALQPCVVLGKHKKMNNPNPKPGEYKSGNKAITHYRKMKFEASEPNVTWFKGDAEIVKSSARYKILPDGSLQILDLRIEDSNIYTCYVTTTIHGPPIIKPKTVQTSLTLATSWSGALWVKPNSPVLDGTLQAINNNNNNVEYNRIPEAYTLPGIPGKPELLTMIHGAKGPMAVTQNTISIVWRAVSENEKGSSQILGYMIEYFTPSDAESGWVVAARRQQGRRVHVTTDLKSGTSNHVTVNVTQLLSGTGYAFLVRAENAYGLGPPSPVSDLIYTLDSPFILDNDVNQKSENHEELSRARYILDQPNIILLKEPQPLSSTAIKLEWEVSKSQQNNLAYIQGFYIKYRLIRPKTLSITDNPQSQQSLTGQQTRLPFQTITLMDNTLHNFVVDNLRPWAPYEFVIAPFYDAIEGWNTPPQLAWTLEDAPSGPPLSFNGQVVNNSHDNNDIGIASDPNTAKSPLIFVKWRRPYFSRQNGRLRGYRLQAFYIANPSSSFSSHINNNKNQAGNQVLSLDKTQKSKLDILIREEPFVSLERVVNTSTMSIVMDPMELFQHGYIKVNGSIFNMETYGKGGKGGEGLENLMINNDGIIRIRVAAFTNAGVGPYTTPIDFAFKPVSSNREISFTNGNLNNNKFSYTLTLMAGYVKAHDPNLENHQKMRDDDDDNINDPYYLDNNNEYYYNPGEYSGPHNTDDNMDYESKPFPIMTRKLNAFSHLSARWLIGFGVGLGWIGILTLILLTYRKFVGLSQQHTSLMHKRSGKDNFCTYLIHTWSGYCCISKSPGKNKNVSTTVGHMQQRQSKHVYDPSNMVKKTYHAPIGNNNDEHKGSSPSPSYCYWNWKNEKSSTTNGKVTTSVVMIPCSNGTQIDDSLSSSNGGQTNLSPPPCQIYTNKRNNVMSTMEQPTLTKIMDHSENLLIDDMTDVCHAAANNTNKSNTNNIQYAFVADNNYNCDNQDPFTLKRCSDRKLNEKIAVAAQNSTNNNPKNNGQNITLSLGRNQKGEPEYNDGRNNYHDEYGLQDSLHIQQLQHRQQPNHYYYFHTLSGGHHANLDTAKNMVIPMIPPPPTQSLTHTQPLYPNHNPDLGPGMNNTHNTNINNVYFSAQDNNHESINRNHQPAGIFQKLWVMFDKRKRNKRDNERKEYGFGRSAVNNLTAQNEVALNLYWQQALLAQQRHPTNNPSDPSHLINGPGYYVTATPYDKNAMGNVNFMPNVVGFDRDGKPCYKSLEAPETAINFNTKSSCMIPNVPPAAAYYYPLPPLQQQQQQLNDGNYHIQRQANGSTLSNPYYRPYSALLCYNNANVKDYPSWATTAQYHNYMDINDIHMVNATPCGNSQRKRQQMTMPPTNHDRGAQTNQPTETESDDNDAHLATTSFDEIHSSGSDSPPVLKPDTNISQGNNTTNTTTPFLYQYYYYDDKRGTNNTGGTYYPTNPACPGIWVPPPCIPPPPPPASTLPPVPGNNMRMPVDVNNNKNKNSGKKSVANSKGMNSKSTNKAKRKKNDGNTSANNSTSKKISNDNNNNLILLDIDDNHNSIATQNNTNDKDNLFLGNLVASSSKLNENNIFNQTIINHHKNFELIDESMNSVNNKNIGRSKQNNPLQPPIYETPQQLMAIGERSKLY